MSTFYDNKNPQNRNNVCVCKSSSKQHLFQFTSQILQMQIEKRSLYLNESFLDAFRDVKVTLDRINGAISSMNQSVSVMKTRLKNTQNHTNDLIQQTNGLQDECKGLEFKQTIAKAFIQRFQLTSSEHQILYGSNSRYISRGAFHIGNNKQLISETQT